MASWILRPSSALYVYLDGALVKEYPDLSMDSDSDNYFLPIINEDTSNHYITVDNLFMGTPTASDRPANFYVSVPKASIACKDYLCRQDVHIVEQYGPAGVGTNDATVQPSLLAQK